MIRKRRSTISEARYPSQFWRNMSWPICINHLLTNKIKMNMKEKKKNKKDKKENRKGENGYAHADDVLLELEEDTDREREREIVEELEQIGKKELIKRAKKFAEKFRVTDG